MSATEFWLRWRRDIVRGAFLFALVVVVGWGGISLSRSMVQRGKESLTQLGGSLGNGFDGDFLANDRRRAEPWTYTAPLRAGLTLWLRNINGSITVDSAAGGRVEIRAERTARHSDPASVRLVAVGSPQGLTVCALWRDGDRCGAGGHFESGGPDKASDAAAVFTVLLPRGVRFDASTVHGDITVSDAAGPVGVGTVMGDLDVETSGGPVRAATVNGDVQVTIHGFREPGDVNLATVHGDVELDLPDQVDAEVEGNTVTGDISSDFPLTVSGEFASHSVTGRLGKGGRRVHLTAVAGDLEVRRAEADAAPVTPREAAPGSSRPRRGTSSRRSAS